MEKYLEACLKSLLQEDTYGYEIICVNDGSTDHSVDILGHYEKENTKLKVVHKENGGVSSARNAGLSYAAGEYVWFVDSDDVIPCGSLKQLIPLLDKVSPEMVEISISAFEDKVNDSKIFQLSYIIEDNNRSVNSAVKAIVKRKILTDHNISFNENMKYGEDTLFWYYVYLFSTGTNRITISTPMYYYRQHEESAMHHKKPGDYDQHVKDLIEMGKIFSEDYTNKIVCDPLKMDNIKKRQHLAILGALTILPKSDLDYKETMIDLKKLNLYPYPFLFWHIIDTSGLKRKVIEGSKLGFCIEPLYKLYYKIIFKKSRFSNGDYLKKRSVKHQKGNRK